MACMYMNQRVETESGLGKMAHFTLLWYAQEDPMPVPIIHWQQKESLELSNIRQGVGCQWYVSFCTNRKHPFPGSRPSTSLHTMEVVH